MAIVTQLQPAAIPGRRYGSFANKELFTGVPEVAEVEQARRGVGLLLFPPTFGNVFLDEAEFRLQVRLRMGLEAESFEAAERALVSAPLLLLSGVSMAAGETVEVGEVLRGSVRARFSLRGGDALEIGLIHRLMVKVYDEALL